MGNGLRLVMLCLWLAAGGAALAEEEALPEGALLRLGEPVEGNAGIVPCLAFSADGTRLAIGRWSLGTEVFDLKAVGSITTVKTTEEVPTAVGFSPDGERLYVGGYYAFYVWEVTTGKKLDQGALGNGEDLAVSPDGKTLVSGTQSGVVRLWDLSAMKARSLGTRSGMTGGLAYSRDGTKVASAGDDGAHVWDVESGKLEVSVSIGKDAFLGAVALSPWNDVFATSADSVVFWSRADGARLSEATRDRSSGYGSGATLFFLPDASLVVWSPSEDGVYFVETSTASVLKRFRPPVRLTSMAVSPDGRTLATGQWDGVVYLWDMDKLLGGAGVAPKGEAAMEEAWTRMGGEDTAAACCAMWEMGDAGEEALTFLSSRVKAVPIEGAERDRFVSLLDDDDADVRERATEALMSLGPSAIPALTKTREDDTSAEARERLRRVIETLSAPTMHFTGEWARQVRAVEVLERIGTSSARDLVRTLAAGAPGAPVTEAARRAHERLGK